jgi:hypothetical protein
MRPQVIGIKQAALSEKNLFLPAILPGSLFAIPPAVHDQSDFFEKKNNHLRKI